MSWSKLDPSVIKSEICIECGRCCKRTQYIGNASNTKFASELIEYVNIIFDDMPNKEFSIRPDRDNTKKVIMRKVCPHLVVDEKYKKCGLWQDPRRPKICDDYNCIDAANHGGKAPEEWDEIEKLIIKHGGEIKPLEVK
jgi:Fe-S-cluster containining protein